MTDHLSPRTLREYRDGRLVPGRMLAVSDHLAACADCRGALAQTDDGPTYEQLADAADGLLDPTARENLAARLADCPAAAAELEDLERFKREMAPQAGRVYGPESPRPQGTLDPRTILAPRVQAWRPRWALLIPAAAAAAVLLAAGLWTLGTPRAVPEATRLLTGRNGERVDYAALPADLREGVARILRGGRLETPLPVSGLRPPAGRLAGLNPNAATGFRPLAPLGVVVREARPVLRWTPLPGATSYVVTVMNLDGSDRRTSPALPAAQTSWTPPDALVSGAIYRWQAEALDGSATLAYTPAPPAAEARFQVLDDAGRAELARIEARFGAFPLVMAVAFAHAGLEEAAAEQVALLAKEHADSPVARHLLEDAQTRAQSPSPITTKGAQ